MIDKENTESTQDIPNKRSNPKKKLLGYFFVIFMIVLSFFAGTRFNAVSYSEYIADFDLRTFDNSEYSCETKFGATIFPEQKYNNDKDYVIVKPEVTKGGSKVALNIDGDTLKFLTSTAVEIGTLEPALFEIIRNDNDKLEAILISQNIDNSVDTIMLDKKTGAAIWTNAGSSSLIPDLPNGQVYYLQCL